MDEGNVCSMEEFDYHIQRFKKMFRTPHKTRMEIVVGNHDIGFHYRYVYNSKPQISYILSLEMDKLY